MCSNRCRSESFWSLFLESWETPRRGANTPARPKRLLALVMGALGGLLLGFGLAFVAEATDEALSTPAQVAAVLKLPVVGSMERVL